MLKRVWYFGVADNVLLLSIIDHPMGESIAAEIRFAERKLLNYQKNAFRVSSGASLLFIGLYFHRRLYPMLLSYVIVL